MQPPQSLNYLFDTPPEPAAVREVAPGVHWIRMPLPFALNHINLWLLDDGPGVAIVDCGLGDEVTRDLWSTVLDAFLRGRPVTKIIVTHLHPDHAGNASWLTERFHAPLYISQSDYLMAHAWRDEAAGFAGQAQLALYERHGLSSEWLQQMSMARGNAYRGGVPDFPVHYRRIMEGQTIAIGGRAWQVIMGFGHAPEHASLYCESLGLVIAGDMLLPRISTNVSVSAVTPDDDPLDQFLRSIERYRELPADTLVLPSHGLVFRGSHERVRQLVEHHRLRLGELEAACDTAKSAAELVPVLFHRSLDGHQMWFAMGEALAHVNYLRHAGRLKAIESDPIVRYARN